MVAMFIPSFSKVAAIEKSLVKCQRNRINSDQRWGDVSHGRKAIRAIRRFAMQICRILDQRFLNGVGIRHFGTKCKSSCI